VEARSRPKCYTIEAEVWKEDLELTRSQYQLSPFQFTFYLFNFCILFLFFGVFHLYIEDNVELKCGDGKYSFESFVLILSS